jgi:hypothetical protein
MILGALYCSMALPLAASHDDRIVVWSVIISGPLFATVSGSVNYNPALGIGWLAIPIIGYYLARPLQAKPWIAIIGVILWFLCGFITILIYN